MTAEGLGEPREGHIGKVTFPKKPKDREEMNHARSREAKSSEGKETWPPSKRIQGSEVASKRRSEGREVEGSTGAPVLTEALGLIDSVKTHCLFSHRAWGGGGADLICISNIIWLLRHPMHEGRAETQTTAMSGER